MKTFATDQNILFHQFGKSWFQTLIFKDSKPVKKVTADVLEVATELELEVVPKDVTQLLIGGGGAF